MTSPSNAKKLNGSQNKAQMLQNLRAANNNSNTSTNENSLPPKGHNKITVGGASDWKTCNFLSINILKLSETEYKLNQNK